MDLPVNVQTGMVVGRYIVDVIDGADVNLDPDAQPVQGRIVFTSSVPYLPNPTAAPDPVTIMRAPIVGVLDTDGYLCTPYPGTVEPQYRGVRLIATDDPDIAVTDWTWDVTYLFEPVNGHKLAIPAHGFALPSGGTVDLTKVAKVPSSPGYSLPQAEAAALRAEEAALTSAQDAADALAAALRSEQAAAATDQGITDMLANPGTQSGGLLADMLDPKANADDVAMALADKAGLGEVQSLIASKADAAETTEALGAKANQTSMDSALGLKADKAAVADSLADKASIEQLGTKADLQSGKVPVAQLPVDALVTDSNVALQVNGTQTGPAIDARINTQVAPQVEQIAADYIASQPAVVDAAAAAVDANPKIAELENNTPRKYEGLQEDVAGGIVDREKRATWLTHAEDGGPTKHARVALGVPEIDSSRSAGGFVDDGLRETELVFNKAGQVPDRVLKAWSSRLTPPMLANRSIWGHSLAAGIAGGASPWSDVLANLLGAPVLNYGVGGSTSLQVAARQGGKPALVTVAGGQIPASGSVSLFMDTDYMFGGVSANQPVTIRGVQGTMTKVADNGEGADCTFARSKSGSVVPVPDGTPMFTNYGDLARADVTYIWAARNDFFKVGTSPEVAVENIARMVDYLSSLHKKVLILEEPPAASEITGTVAREEVDAYNTAIRTAFPQYWVPIMTWLRTPAAATVAGITFTTQDQTDIAAGVTPSTFRVDTLHLSTAGNTAVARRLFTEELNRGWI